MKKIPATTLVETLTAILLLSLAFAGGMMLYLNIIQSHQQVLITRANAILNTTLTNTKLEKAHFDDVFEIQGITVERQVMPHPSGSVYVLHLTASTPEGKLILELKDLLSP